MNIAEIKKLDIANGPGIRTSVFVSGCTRQCEGCFNKAAWDFSYGTPYLEETEQYILELLSYPYVQGLTILGGEPFEGENQAGVSQLVQAVCRAFPDKDIWCFTGYTLDELMSPDMCTLSVSQILNQIDVLVDGPFIQSKKNLMLNYRGSENQRIIDMERTRQTSRIQLWEDRFSQSMTQLCKRYKQYKRITVLLLLCVCFACVAFMYSIIVYDCNTLRRTQQMQLRF